MYSGDEFYGEEVTSPFEMQRQIEIENYTGNSTIGFDADEHTPTAILQCRFCPERIDYFGDDDVTDGRIVLTEYQAVCYCGAIYGEGDWLEVVDEDASQCSGFGCVDAQVAA